MVGKIPDEAEKVYLDYQNSNNLDDQIKYLSKFLQMISNIKGTEKTQAQNRNILNELKKRKDQELQRQKKKTGGGTDAFSIKKGDHIQLVLISKYFDVGVGKTKLLRSLTGAARDLVGIFTAEPQIGVYNWENIDYHVVDAPALLEGASIGVGNGPKIFSLSRNSDLICLCIDLSRDPLEQMDFLLKEFESVNIRLNTKKPPISIEKTGSNKIQILFQNEEAKQALSLKDDIEELCNTAGYHNARIKIWGNISLNEVTDSLNPGVAYKKAIIIGTKGDSSNSKENFQKLNDIYGLDLEKELILSRYGEPIKFHIFPVSIKENERGQEYRTELLQLGELVFKDLNLVRIYTKSKDGVSERPMVFDRNMNVGDVAEKIHKEFAENFKYAILYRSYDRMDKKRVGKDFELQDLDVIEIHATEK